LFLYLTPFLEQYWQPLSRAVGATTAFFLKFTFSGAFFDPNTFYLGVREFSVYVYKPCSGVEGIRLFLFLFTLVLIFDWKKVAKFRALLVAAVGTAVMFLADVFRIYAIMFLGYVIYKKMGHEAAYRIVLEQFHSHFGWFFYILVLLILFRLSYPFLIRFSSQEKPEAKAIGPS
jgi:exosortase/archaeosortase family protein